MDVFVSWKKKNRQKIVVPASQKENHRKLFLYVNQSFRTSQNVQTARFWKKEYPFLKFWMRHKKNFMKKIFLYFLFKFSVIFFKKKRNGKNFKSVRKWKLNRDELFESQFDFDSKLPWAWYLFEKAQECWCQSFENHTLQNKFFIFFFQKLP